VSIRINVDLRELYRRLPPECRKILIQYIKEKLDEALIEKMILGEEGEKGAGPSLRPAEQDKG
jgi:hypothetical protein